MTKSANQRKADERARMRERGYILRQVWVHPDDWEKVRTYIAVKQIKRDDALSRIPAKARINSRK